MAEGYLAHVRAIESGLNRYAFKTNSVTTFTDSTDAIKSFEDQWREESGRARLSGRTPLMLERDRILYSEELRSQSDRHHILFFGDARVARDYASHILRMSQVSRAICGRLGLNSDLAEAIALGAKVGGVPFIHVGKKAVDRWVRAKIKSLDTGTSQPVAGVAGRRRNDQLALLGRDGNSLPLPTWVDELEDPKLREDVKAFVPWAAGATDAAAYSSGQQSYWALSLRPFQLQARRPFVPQTMYGIWNHSLTAQRDTARFRHEVVLRADGTQLTITDSHLTHEAVVVRYADDVTWVVENLSEASKASSLANRPNETFNNLASELRSNDVPAELQTALSPVPDLGQIYTYFINDLVKCSQAALTDAGDAAPSETQPLVGLSETASRMLRSMKRFLGDRVFSEERIEYRNRTLEALTATVLDVFWDTRGKALHSYLVERAKLEGWTPDDLAASTALLGDPVHRVQASVDALSLMSDREVYRVLGLEAQ
ncbi:MAG: hypothetical protein L0H96_11250 [Humibacillus sp.]|nr:hypothetical protein [Humibacillus sp.]MDN5777478.1 hypothetical protein [Humibacillus sp.]